MSGQREKRQAPRIPPFVAPCRYSHGGRRLAGFLTDLSTRGGRIHTDEPPPTVGERLQVDVKLSRRPARLELMASVEWSRASTRGGHVFGVSFEEVSDEAREVLAGIVEEFRRRAASIEQR